MSLCFPYECNKNGMVFEFREYRSEQCKCLSDSDPNHDIKCCWNFLISRMVGIENDGYTCPIYFKFKFGEKLLTEKPPIIKIPNGLTDEDYLIHVSCVRDCPPCMKSKCAYIGSFSPLRLHDMFVEIALHISLHSVVEKAIILEEELKHDDVYDIAHNGDGTFKCLCGCPCRIKETVHFNGKTGTSFDKATSSCPEKMTLQESNIHHEYALEMKNLADKLETDPVTDMTYDMKGTFYCNMGLKCISSSCQYERRIMVKPYLCYKRALYHHAMYMRRHTYAKILASATHGRIGEVSPVGIIDANTFKNIISLVFQ